MGLAGLVQSELGQELDKTLQCSAWGARPLSHEQVQRYYTPWRQWKSCAHAFSSDWPPASAECGRITRRWM